MPGSLFQVFFATVRFTLLLNGRLLKTAVFGLFLSFPVQRATYRRRWTGTLLIVRSKIFTFADNRATPVVGELSGFILLVIGLMHFSVDFRNIFHYHTSMVFYTDTNGSMPELFSTALVMLGIVMESTPVGEIDFDQFNRICSTLDNPKFPGF
jgi:hypothetical protein